MYLSNGATHDLVPVTAMVFQRIYRGKSQNRNAPSHFFSLKTQGLGHSVMAPLF